MPQHYLAMNQALRAPPQSFVACLAFLLSVATLLTSPALAQVNGPGPSPANLFDVVLNLPDDETIVTGVYHESIGGVTGQTIQLNVNDDGFLSLFFNAESGSEVNINGGYVARGFDAHSGSEVNISGGTVKNGFNALAGSAVNISGGVNFSGAYLDSSFNASDGSVVKISGGSFGAWFEANAGSDVELIGGEFRLNGTDFSGSTITLADDDVFTGTLADGSSFIFSKASSDVLTDVNLTTAKLPVTDLNPILVNSPILSGPSGLRSGQTLTLQAGGSLRDNFAVVDATLNVEGGTVGIMAEATDSVVNISGGVVGDGFDALSGSEVNISDGIVRGGFNASDGSVVNISGGTVSRAIDAGDGSVVNISGGAQKIVHAHSGAVVNIFGSAFYIDSEQLDTLVPGEAFTITNRNMTLTGLLADGEQFSFDLNSEEPSNRYFFASDATLTVTLSFILGDVNLDGAVNFLDISPFLAILTRGSFQVEADIDRNNEVNFLDIAPFVRLLSEQ